MLATKDWLRAEVLGSSPEGILFYSIERFENESLADGERRPVAAFRMS